MRAYPNHDDTASAIECATDGDIHRDDQRYNSEHIPTMLHPTNSALVTTSRDDAHNPSHTAEEDSSSMYASDRNCLPTWVTGAIGDTDTRPTASGSNAMSHWTMSDSFSNRTHGMQDAAASQKDTRATETSEARRMTGAPEPRPTLGRFNYSQEPTAQQNSLPGPSQHGTASPPQILNQMSVMVPLQTRHLKPGGERIAQVRVVEPNAEDMIFTSHTPLLRDATVTRQQDVTKTTETATKYAAGGNPRPDNRKTREPPLEGHQSAHILAMEREIKGKERQLGSRERILEQREKEMCKQQSQLETAKSCMVGYENRIKELEHSNRILHQIINATGKAQPAAQDNQEQVQHTNNTEMNHSGQHHAGPVAHSRVEKSIIEMETRITDRMLNMESRISANQMQVLILSQHQKIMERIEEMERRLTACHHRTPGQTNAASGQPSQCPQATNIQLQPNPGLWPMSIMTSVPPYGHMPAHVGLQQSMNHIPYIHPTHSMMQQYLLSNNHVLYQPAHGHRALYNRPNGLVHFPRPMYGAADQVHSDHPATTRPTHGDIPRPHPSQRAEHRNADGRHMQQPQGGRTANHESRSGQRLATNSAPAARSQPTNQHQPTLPTEGLTTMHSESARQTDHMAPLISFDDDDNAAIIRNNRIDSETADPTQNEHDEAHNLTSESGKEDTDATRPSQAPVHDLLQNLVLGASSMVWEQMQSDDSDKQDESSQSMKSLARLTKNQEKPQRSTTSVKMDILLPSAGDMDATSELYTSWENE